MLMDEQTNGKPDPYIMPEADATKSVGGFIVLVL